MTNSIVVLGNFVELDAKLLRELSYQSFCNNVNLQKILKSLSEIRHNGHIESFSELVVIEPSIPYVKISFSYWFVSACSRRIIDSISTISHISNVRAIIDDDHLGI